MIIKIKNLPQFLLCMCTPHRNDIFILLQKTNGKRNIFYNTAIERLHSYASDIIVVAQ